MANAKLLPKQAPRISFSIPFTRGLGESLRIAFDSLRGNKLRTILTMLGIIIGVASVVALIAIGNGATSSITERIASNGTNLLSISPGQSSGGGAGGGVRTTAQTLTMADAEALENLPGVAYVAPAYQGNSQIVSTSSNSQATVLGVTEDYFTVHNLTLGQGELLTSDNVDNNQSVVVIGSGVADDLYSGQNAVGSTLRIDGQAFRIVGVLEESGSSGGMGGSVDDQVFVPIGVAQLKLYGARSTTTASLLVSSIGVQVASTDEIDTTQSLIEATLRNRHKVSADGTEDDFSVFDQTSLLETLSETTATLTAFLGAIAGISLFVGGIGVMNIMLVSVTERTREIGLRKAVGARRSDIMQQFLIEAVLVSVIGGLIGVALGVGIAYAVELSGIFTPTIKLWSIVLAMGFSIAVGLFFGIYPARRAARLRPIEALRYD